MKILLRAFGGKLSGYMEVPENTTPRFDLALTQPISCFNNGYYGKDIPLMEMPLTTRCTFEWTGKIEMFNDGKNVGGARVYELTKIQQ